MNARAMPLRGKKSPSRRMDSRRRPICPNVRPAKSARNLWARERSSGSQRAMTVPSMWQARGRGSRRALEPLGLTLLCTGVSATRKRGCAAKRRRGRSAWHSRDHDTTAWHLAVASRRESAFVCRRATRCHGRLKRPCPRPIFTFPPLPPRRWTSSLGRSSTRLTGGVGVWKFTRPVGAGGSVPPPPGDRNAPGRGGLPSTS